MHNMVSELTPNQTMKAKEWVKNQLKQRYNNFERRLVGPCTIRRLVPGGAELVDAPDSKSGFFRKCEFDSRPRHHFLFYNSLVLKESLIKS